MRRATEATDNGVVLDGECRFLRELSGKVESNRIRAIEVPGNKVFCRRRVAAVSTDDAYAVGGCRLAPAKLARRYSAG